jgi:membrane protease YdiL (CAAX protease family)
VACGLLWLYGVYIIIWQTLAPLAITRLADSTLALNRAYQSDLFTALLLACVAGISEELFFRGAMQPRLGIVLTTVFFVAFHPHLWLTIGMVWVGGLGLVWGFVRQYQNTNTAIVAHICYNFLPVVLMFALGTV